MTQYEIADTPTKGQREAVFYGPMGQQYGSFLFNADATEGAIKEVSLAICAAIDRVESRRQA